MQVSCYTKLLKRREAAVNIDAKKLALKRRQRKQVRDINKNNPICVEEHQSKQTDVKMWIPELELSSSDKEILPEVQLLGSQTQLLMPLKTC